MASVLGLTTTPEDSVQARSTTFLNSARRSPMPRPAYDAMLEAIARDCRGEERDEEQPLSDARFQLAELIGADPDEIALTQSASDSCNRVINALAWRHGDNVVATDISYRTLSMALLRLRDECGVSIRVAATDTWQIEPEAIYNLVDARTRLVVIDHVPVFCGVVQPIETIGNTLRESKALFLVNATQSAGQLPIDVDKIHCAFLIGTSRKWLRGPRGLGFMFVRRALIEQLRPPAIGYPATQWSAVDRFECVHTIDRLRVGDQPYQLFSGLAAAVRYARGIGIRAIAEKNAQLGALCRGMLRSVKGVTLYDAERGATGTVPFNIHNVSADTAVGLLDQLGVRVCALYAENARMAFARVSSDSLVRASLHYFNSEKDIAHLGEAIERIRDRELMPEALP